jgi:hypothetical protein
MPAKTLLEQREDFRRAGKAIIMESIVNPAHFNAKLLIPVDKSPRTASAKLLNCILALEHGMPGCTQKINSLED